MKAISTCVAAALAISIGGIPTVAFAAEDTVPESPIINEFAIDQAGTDIHEYVEVLTPGGVDLTVLSVEGDNNPRQGTVLTADPVGSSEAGRQTVNYQVNGLQNGSLSLLLVSGTVPAKGTDLDQDDDGVVDAESLGFTIHDSIGVVDTDPEARSYGEITFDRFGGASRIPDGGSDWVENDYDGAGLIDSAGNAVAGTPEAGEALNTPEAENQLADDGSNPSEPEDPEQPTDPPAEVCEADVTPIHDVQGSDERSPMVGQTTTVRGIVTGDFQEGGFDGYFIQEPDATVDDDPATSEGVFVYAKGGTDVAVGDLVTVTGSVSEYYDKTQITASSVTDCGTAELPAPIEIEFPLTDREPLEGMRVNVSEARVLETYQYGRYGQIAIGPERQFTPTTLHAPETQEAQDLFEANLANSIMVDDGRSAQNPDPAMHLNGEEFTMDNLFSGGDTFKNVTGVLDYSFDNFMIQPTQAAEYEDTVTREEQAPEVGGDISVAAFNVLNYFTTLNKRGATTNAELVRQRDKLVSAITEIDADVVGFMEIENNNDTAVKDLVNALNDGLGADVYEPVLTGKLGTDEITTAVIYKPETVTPDGNFEALNESVDSRFDTSKNRPALAQSFTVNENGDDLGSFTIITNHLKSKGSACAEDPNSLNDLVGNCNEVRTDAAEALVDWSEQFDKPVIMGDLNAYAKEAPITTMIDAGYVDLKREYEGDNTYSYVFDGQLGYLDYALASEELAPFVTGAASWHTNSDEPSIIDYTTQFKKPAQQALYAPDAFRSSDHDPVVFGLSVQEQPANPDPTSVVINEVESNGDPVGDWVELANTDTENDADISGWTVLDDDATHDPVVIPEGTVIESGGYFSVYTEPNFGLGGNDSVLVYNRAGELVDETTWEGHAATTWGRVPDMTGDFTVTGEPTRNMKNVAESNEEPANTRPWPSDPLEIVELDPAKDTWSEDMSGLDFGPDGTLYMVNNGEGTLHTLSFNGETFDEESVYQLRYPDGAGTPDAEGVTVGVDGVIYVATERNNDDKGVSRPSVLQFELPEDGEGAELAASAEWNLAEIVGTSIGANAGLEAIEWLPQLNAYAVGVEATGQVHFVQLPAGESATEVREAYQSPFPGVMALDYQESTGLLTVLCDEVCDGQSVQLQIAEDSVEAVTDEAGETVIFARPEGLPNTANEGYAKFEVTESAPAVARMALQASSAKTLEVWSDDAVLDGFALRGAVPAADNGETNPGGGGDNGGGNSGEGGTGGNNGGAGNGNAGSNQNSDNASEGGSTSQEAASGSESGLANTGTSSWIAFSIALLLLASGVGFVVRRNRTSA